MGAVKDVQVRLDAVNVTAYSPLISHNVTH